MKPKSRQHVPLYHIFITIRKIMEEKCCHPYKKYPEFTIVTYMVKSLVKVVGDQRKLNKGSRRKLIDCHQRLVLRQVRYLKNTVGWFTCKIILVNTRLIGELSIETIRRLLRKSVLNYFIQEKKGLLKIGFSQDEKYCLKFARKVKRLLDQKIRTKDIYHSI